MTIDPTRTTYHACKVGEPAWEIAELFPRQGQWTDLDYLNLPGNRPIELINGCVRFLPMPTDRHQLILAVLFGALLASTKPKKLGRVRFAALPVRLWKDHFREPDLLFMLAEHEHRCGEKYWDGADLVMEIVSKDSESHKRDYREKRADYARARIPEYWIVDPQEETITVLRLRGKKYVVHGKFGMRQQATSVVLKGFTVDVDELFSGEGV